MDRPLILVSNDDGISAPGIRALIDVVREIGDVVVVAPDGPQSGMGHAITLNSTLRCDQIHIDDGPQIEYECSGTPSFKTFSTIVLTTLLDALKLAS